MATCRSCGQSLVPSARFCPACGTPVDAADQPTTFDDTAASSGGVTFAPADRSPGPTTPRSGTQTGWLASSHALDHGRFPPGTVLGGRYRIVARLGQGGMGEVYRADDLKLGQAVALKFLPAALERDPARLEQFHNEVRLARQISHKNVCRMYDVGEAEGLPFLTMEYVDGEDLATLLRRIGRLPPDKALDIARQLCAGVAAAHERGVLHRDLKPANVMIDGQGQVRITDFGLAAIAGDADQVHAGTPGYMAPEQLAGEPATVASDLFALGLVLYELFTGRRAFTAQSVGDLMRQHRDAVVTPPTAVVRELEAGVERAILRCLERDPARRPATALAVAAALPGGDPLAAALAAGETPSPEMIAAAGERSATANRYAILAAIGSLVLVTVVAVIDARREVTNRAPLDRSPAVLIDRAQAVLQALGYSPRGVDRAWSIESDDEYLTYVADHPDGIAGTDPFTERPYGVFFYYRTSPRILTPLSRVSAISMRDPPLTVSDMTLVVLDTAGHLETFHAIPPERDDRTNASAAADWTVLFRLADLDPSKFSPATPTWLPRGEADARAAWVGTYPDRPGTPIRVEAAAWHGRPTYFQVVGPWRRPTQMQETPVSRGVRAMNVLAVGALVFLLFSAVLVARMNLKRDRGDRRSAARVAAIAVVGQLVAWMFNDPHVADASEEVNRFFASVGEALFAGGLLYVMYLALEPAVRRHWPDSLLGWTRLLQGRVFDPRVGRDVLIGLAVGAAWQLLILGQATFQRAAGAPVVIVETANTRYFEGVTYVLGFLASIVTFQGVFNAMWVIFTIVGLKRVLKRTSVVAAVTTALFTFVATRDLFTDAPGMFSINLGVALTVSAIMVTLAIRFGLLATVVAFVVSFVLSATPWTLDVTAWHFPPVAVAGGVVLALAAAAGWALRSGPALRA